MQTKYVLSACCVLLVFVGFSCQKMLSDDTQNTTSSMQKEAAKETPPFNLEVILRGADKQFGLVKFRQDIDVDKIVTLDTWVRGLEPNHAYMLRRAIDTQIDGNCTGTTWLTLGAGLDPRAIVTDAKGEGRTALFRDLATIPSSTMFDIYFQVVDAATLSVVLRSDCYTYTVQ